mgnify:CR=1 FL=1
MAQNTQPQTQDLNEILRLRREKFENFKAEGKDPFVITKYDVTNHSKDIKDYLINDILPFWLNHAIDEKNGGIYTQDFIDRFLIACEDCFDGRNFTKRNCLTMVKFIYKIRCNIFHGSKTLQDMHDPSQQKRIEIYTAIIIAVNQMVFSYLEYLANGWN